MSRFSWPLLIAASTAALLAACAGGNGTTSSVLTPQATRPAIESIVATVGGTPALGSPGTYKITITAKGSDGTPLTGTYATPIILTDSDTSGATRLSTTSVASSTTAVSLDYNGLGGSSLGGFQGATITATSGSATSQVVFLSSSACTTFKAIAGYYPCDLQSAYSLPSGTAGTGQTVAIVDAFDYPKAEADLGVYRSQFGLSPCTTANHCFVKVNQRGAQNNPPVPDHIGWSAEAALDLDMVSAICPNCRILFVEADSDEVEDLAASVDQAAALGATQISNSYAAAEYPGETAVDVHYNHPGSMVVVASGDAGYGVSYPASSPYVTAVGGTNLSAAANGRGWYESAWNNANVQGAGSGCSNYEPKPAWQHDAGCPNNRMVADVSAVADPFTGVAVYNTYITKNTGGWQSIGGTSAAAPIIAAVYALAGASAATLNYASYPYGHPGGFNDITAGNNGGCGTFIQYFCTAEVGYDGPTGMGTPYGVGGFGGHALGSAQSVRSTQSLGLATARRTVLQAPVGSPVTRVCNDPKPGHFACNAIFVQRAQSVD